MPRTPARTQSAVAFPHHFVHCATFEFINNVGEVTTHLQLCGIRTRRSLSRASLRHVSVTSNNLTEASFYKVNQGERNVGKLLSKPTTQCCSLCDMRRPKVFFSSERPKDTQIHWLTENRVALGKELPIDAASLEKTRSYFYQP